MRILKLFATVLAVSALPGAASATDLKTLPPALAEKVESAQSDCASFENGAFTLDWGAVTRVDLDGDMDLDWSLDESSFQCSSAASLYCGTGGCMSHFLIDGHVSSILNRGWRIVEIGHDQVLLADVHGSECGGINPTPCITASVWDKEASQWRSTSANWTN